MREIKVIAAYPKHEAPHVFMVFFSDGTIFEYDSKLDSWFEKRSVLTARNMFV